MKNHWRVGHAGNAGRGAVVGLLTAVAMVAGIVGHGGAPMAFAGPDDNTDNAWLDDLATARQTALRQRRLLFVVIWRPDDRGDKRYMSRTIESRTVEGELGAAFVRVRVDAESAEGRTFQRNYQTRALPAIWIFTPDSRPLKAIEGTVTATRLRDEIKDVKGRFAEAQRPPDPESFRPLVPSDREPPTRSFEHAASCPRGCAVCESAIVKGLRWLASQQQRDGSFRRPRVHADAGHSSSLDFTRVALTATAGLAFLANGHTPASGDHARIVRQIVRWLREQIREDGVISESAENDLVHQVYLYWQMPLAMLFLAEVARLEPGNSGLRNDLARAAETLVREQARDGGWGYGLAFGDRDPATEFGWTMIGPTGLCVMALAAAKSVGVAANESAMARGLGYLLDCQHDDGGARYRKNMVMASYPEATAVVALGLGVLGKTDMLAYAKATSFLRTRLGMFGTALNEHPYFGRACIALAMARQGGDPASGTGSGGSDWHMIFRDYALSEQEEDGHWPDSDDCGGKVWSTATNLLAMSAAIAPAHLWLASPDARPTAPAIDGTPDYQRTPDPKCRWKIFAVNSRDHASIRHGVDLCVGIESVDGERVPDAYAERLGEAFQFVADLLFDCTDGAVYLRQVSIDRHDRDPENADIRFTRRQFTGVDGMTRTIRVLRNGRDDAAFGETIECPLRLASRGDLTLESGGGWNTAYGRRVLTHELGHYLFALPDEYSQGSGAPRCRGCLMAGSAAAGTEFCAPATHTDEHVRQSCWQFISDSFSRLRPPSKPDPGPYLAPAVRIIIERE